MAKSPEPMTLELATLAREQMGPFLILGVDKSGAKDKIEAQWARRLKECLSKRVNLAREDVNWAKEMLGDRDKRLRADAASLNLDTADGLLGQLTTRYNAVAKSSHLRLPPDALDVNAHDTADLQVDVMWECDYCDVDLHVIEPGGEEVMYSHRKSKHDGELSDDITGGFGPEIYAIARAPRGAYKVVLEYFGNDATEVSAETLVHVIVTTRGRFSVHRRDYTLLLSRGKERTEVTTANVE